MDAKFVITTNQYDDHGKVDTIKIESVGNLYNKNDDLYLVYKEKEENVEITTTIKLSDDKVSVKRFGATNSTMMFKEGEKYTSQYRTPQGIFVIETKTRKLKIDRKEDEYIKIEIDYNIDIMGMFSGRNKMNIHVVPEIK